MSLSLCRLAAALTIASFALSANAQTVLCEPASPGGLVPSSGTGDGTYPTVLPSFPFIGTTTCTSTGSPDVLTELKLNGFNHTWVGDVHVVLESPSAVKYNIFCRGGVVDFSCDYSGNYVFTDPCAPGAMSVPAACTTVLTPGTYGQNFGTWVSGTNGIFNTPMNTIIAEPGTWTLYIYDWVGADGGTLTDWELCWGNAISGPSGVPALVSPPNAGTSAHQANLIWNPACFATSYDVDVDGVVTTGVVGTSLSYFVGAGSHTWTVRGVNGFGPGAYAPTQTFDVLLPAGVCSQIQTIYATNNSGSAGGQVFFDMNVTAAGGINLGQIAVNTAQAGAFTLTVYSKAGSYVGFNTTPGAWTVLTSGGGVGSGVNLPSIADVTDVVIPAGSYGIALKLDAAHAFSYTNGTGANQNYSNADLALSLGMAQNVQWTGGFTPRVFNGTIYYNCQPGIPFVFCTAGTTTNGCVASISATAQPQVDLGGPCVINVTNVEGNKAAILFYGLDNAGYTPFAWGGSSSYLCVKPPSQRTGAVTSTGTTGACDGTLTLDWNVYQAANPTSLGNPFNVGDTIYMQAWFRDPPSPKTTNLSDAVELVQQP